ncbi:GNAT family N-acetyltransferase [Cucumibacter marinus]|uniref:GNAT family N-acetyltransferase n=1 Tax=Cucumibacter marinus TaxID=1121252 RepID=UPI000423CBEC|nr:GNAT family N-acetyltransferase [Cucumibacter marinus]
MGYRVETEADQDILIALYRSTRESELAQTPWDEAEKQAFVAMQFRAQHTHYRAHYPDALWLIIERGCEAIGRLYLERWSDEHRIIDIALIPAARGHGFGGAILADLIEEAEAVGKPVSIHVEKTNPAMSLYRRLGFAVVEDKGVYDLLRRPVGAANTTA